MKNTNIVIATTSEQRQHAFGFLGVPFIVEESGINEREIKRPDDPYSLVSYLSKLKAQTVSLRHTDGIFIGFNSVGYFNGEIIEKTKKRHEAYERLRNFSENTHSLITGVYIINRYTKKEQHDISETQITFRELKDIEIEEYLDRDDSYQNFALSYNPIEGYSASFVKDVKGSLNNLRSIPLERIVSMLEEVGYKR